MKMRFRSCLDHPQPCPEADRAPLEVPEVHRTPGQLSGPRVPCRPQGKAEDDSGSFGTALQLLFKHASSLDKSSPRLYELERGSGSRRHLFIDAVTSAFHGGSVSVRLLHDGWMPRTETMGTATGGPGFQQLE